MMENLLIFIAKLGVVALSIMIFLILLEYKRQYDSGYWSGKKRTPGSGTGWDEKRKGGGSC